MNIVLWIVQALLAVAFLMAGTMKVMKPKSELAEQIGGWVEDFSDQQVKGIGILEILGAIGLILPWALNILPILTPIAALGLLATMVGAFMTHRRRGEPFTPNIVLGALALFVVIGRFFL